MHVGGTAGHLSLGFRPDPRAYVDFLRRLGRSPSSSPLRRVRHLHAHLVVLGLLPQPSLDAHLAVTYSRSGDLQSASLLLLHAPCPTPILFNALLRSHSLRASTLDVVHLFCRMLARGLAPDHFSFPFALKSSADLADLPLGRSLHSQCLRRGLEQDAYISSSLVNMYAKCNILNDAHHVFNEMPLRLPSSWNALIAGYMKVGTFETAEKLFNDMPNRNIVSWTTMISGYCQNGLANCALKLYDTMQRENSEVKPNWVTVVSVLPACAHSAELEQGERIHHYASAMGFDLHPTVQIALIGMYAKCGNLAKARYLFDKISERNKDVIAWNTMITGYASHGLGIEAVSTFENMLRSGVRPDPITFTGLLSGCSHSGLIDQGLAYFDSMKRVYFLEPQSEHYACVVDLYGRAGRLPEAMEMIEGMEIEAGPSVWGALLSACRTHRNVELAEIAATKLFMLEPENSANYVLLWNMYSELGRWEEVKRVKALMRERGTKKNPGCSWTDTNVKGSGEGERSCFPLDSDKSRTKTTEVYMSSEDLAKARRLRCLPRNLQNSSSSLKIC